MRRWLLTGASSGIGEALARKALAESDAVVGAARDKATLDHLTGLAPGRFLGLQRDLAHDEQVSAAIEAAGCGLAEMHGPGACCASKFALEGCSEALAAAAAAFGMTVLRVEPGAVAGCFTRHGTHETKARLPDYALFAGSRETVLDACHAEAASPPDAVADAIVAALPHNPLPVRIAVGDDVRAPAASKAGSHALAVQA